MDDKPEAKKYTRRQFLETIGKAVLAPIAVSLDYYLSHFPGYATPLTPLWESLETDSLVQSKAVSELERKYGVVFFDPPEPVSVAHPALRDILGDTAFIEMNRQNPDALLTQWDAPRLTLFDEVLSALPASFYTSTQGRVTFVLWQGQGMSRREPGETDAFRALCACDSKASLWDHLKNQPVKSQHAPTAIFVKRDLRALQPIDRKTAHDTIVHELAHLATLGPQQYVNDRNPLIDGALANLGLPAPEKYNDPDEGLLNLFSRHVQISRDKTGKIENFLPREDDLFGTSVIPTEFIAIAAENYFEGDENFRRVYANDLSPTQIDNLYAFIRDQIFEGRVYQNGKLLPPHP